MFSRRLVNLSTRRISSSRLLRGGHAEPEFNEPGGYLFNRKPGEKYQKESWENITYYGFIGTMIFAAVGVYFKPDTTIRGWARKEAEARMAARGDVLDYKRTEYKI
ncbi:hypothetical protein BB560_003658 [Smittium megazygosporum]|uniref:NADH dehydrogenase [ubiquinone] 1 beta subcomplex subunit 11, mitochondrial n=1 Tax=Smittium megazygosporum TaxID=133381 RepID=A0A2T9ZBF1_9FUNG|nr:hypothetical protein BB560_003658 [Smittium megazygosporum]